VSLPSPLNPFEESIDPQGYVPRAACAEALSRLERQVWAGAPAILLRGPAGIGKSMLLAVLHQRMAEGWQIAHVAVSPSPSMELSHRILDLLEVNAGDDPSSALVAAARSSAASGRRVLVIIDRATHVPVASSRQLARAAARAGGDLCIVFAVTDEEGAEAFEREIGAEAELVTIRFDAPMNAQETSEYIAWRLDQTLDSRALRDRFDAAALRYVIEGAEGNPRRVNELAYEALRRLERGEDLPVRDRDAAAAAEPDAGEPASRPSASAASFLQSGPSTTDQEPHSHRSLGGGLLGAGPARDPRELDATRELFPPGFLRSGRSPLATPPEPEPGRSPTPAAGRATAATDRGDARSGAEEPAPELTTERERPTPSRDRGPEQTPERDDAISPGAATAEPATAASSNRPKLWVAALVVTALAGGYLAGRFDRVSTQSSPLPAAAPIAAARPVARDAEPVSPEPLPAIVRPDRAGPDAPSRSAAVAPSTPAALPDTSPAAAIDSGDSGSALADTQPVAASPSHAEAAAAEPEGLPGVDAVEQAAVALPPVSAPAAAPDVSPDRPQPNPSAPSPAPTAEPRAEATRVASDSGARSRPQPPPGSAPGSAVDSDSSVDRERSIADGAVTAIVVGARSTEEPGARAPEYVRVRVRLEPGASLTIDGERVGVAPFSDLIMEPGLHTFVAELPGGLQIEQLVQVSPETGIVEF
jgi:type II secretory pathway predicted ATPase ExeA